jgi:hypothetical protein
MTLSFRASVRALSALCLITTATALAQESPPPAPPPDAVTGPVIELPPEEVAPAPSTDLLVPRNAVKPAAEPEKDERLFQLGVRADSDALTRGLQQLRMAQPRTVIGGYGQFTLNSVKPGNSSSFNTTASVRRLVLFVAHPITDNIRVYTEFEWENAVACQNCQGAAEVEQAFVHWRLLGDALAFRVGLLLVPMGVVNQWHEPPVFHGVERPMVDQFIIPSTWRELGAGFQGTLNELLRYELYLTTTLNPLRLGESGLSNARTMGSIAPAGGYAVTGRAEVEPWLGVIGGASFFLSDTGPNADYYRQNGSKRNLSLPVLGYSLDARMRRFGFEARVVWAQFFLPNSDDLVAAYRADGSPLFPREATKGTVPTRIQGGYIEVAYDVLSLLHVSHELLAFVRLETYDTQAAVPATYYRNPNLDVNELTLGVTYRPVTQLVFKADFQLRDRRLGYDEVQWNLGFGYMF